jgi:hypothetical protein
MAADWWDIYGPRRSDDDLRRCWDCDRRVAKDIMGPDGVRCRTCWMALARAS